MSIRRSVEGVQEPGERRQLKHRANGDSRTISAHPELVALLRSHLKEFGTAPDGRPFTGVHGRELATITYRRALISARKAALTPEEQKSPLARRPYDLQDNELGASTYHGRGGPMPVTTAPDLSALSLAFITAGVEEGLDLNRDFNGARRDGVGLLYSNVRNGERVSAARGYLHPVLHRTGLTVLTGATARRVVIQNRAVTGVEYTDAEGRRNIAQSPSVVLCAGTLRTPHLLMLSGIGPADELAARGIEVVTDLPGVGHNLHDHPHRHGWLAGHAGRDVGRRNEPGEHRAVRHIPARLPGLDRPGRLPALRPRRSRP